MENYIELTTRWTSPPDTSNMLDLIRNHDRLRSTGTSEPGLTLGRFKQTLRRLQRERHLNFCQAFLNCSKLLSLQNVFELSWT